MKFQLYTVKQGDLDPWGDLDQTPDFLSTKSQIWFKTDKSKILPLFTEIWSLSLHSYFPVPESRND